MMQSTLIQFVSLTNFFYIFTPDPSKGCQGKVRMKSCHSVLYEYCDVNLLVTLCVPRPSLISALLKISGALRHVGICLIPIALMNTDSMSKIGVGRHGLRAQTLPLEPVHPPPPTPVCALQRAAFIKWKELLPCLNGRLTLYQANSGDNKGLGFADNLYKPAVTWQSYIGAIFSSVGHVLALHCI